MHFQGPWATEGRSLGDARPVTAVKRAVEAAVYRRADVCVVLSEAFGELLHKEFGVPRWAVHRVLPGVDLDTFAPGDQRKARRALGLDLDVWTAVTVRRLYPRMGLDVLLRSWSWLVSVSEQPVRLLIVGDGPERRSLEGQIARLGLRDSVKLLGLVDDDTLVDLFRAADLSVVPSVALEGFGLVVLESLACGTPALGTSAGGLPEMLEQLDQDLVVPANDADRLGHRLLKAATDPASVPTRQDCRAFAEHFTWEEVARSHLDLYRLVADLQSRWRGKARRIRRKGGASESSSSVSVLSCPARRWKRLAGCRSCSRWTCMSYWGGMAGWWISSRIVASRSRSCGTWEAGRRPVRLTERPLGPLRVPSCSDATQCGSVGA